MQKAIDLAAQFFRHYCPSLLSAIFVIWSGVVRSGSFCSDMDGCAADFAASCPSAVEAVQIAGKGELEKVVVSTSLVPSSALQQRTASDSPTSSASGTPDQAVLVNQNKVLQKSGPAGKKAWQSFCDAQLGGRKDPNKHDASILQGFIQSYRAGAVAMPTQVQDAVTARAGTSRVVSRSVVLGTVPVTFWKTDSQLASRILCEKASRTTRDGTGM